MANEIEAKIKVHGFAAVLSSLKAAGAEFIIAREDIDQFYDAPGGKLRSRDCGLRVRTIRMLPAGRVGDKSSGSTASSPPSGSAGDDPGKSTQSLLTYKGPRKASSKLKVRLEVQTHIADAKAMGRILKELGFTPTMIVRKKRIRYHVMGCMVELDELRGIGQFVEIEGPSERAVNKVIRDLQIVGQPTVESYISMVAKRKQR